jgi:hypothetical protein
MRRPRVGRSTFMLKAFGGDGLVWERCKGYEWGTKGPKVEVIRDQGYEWSKRQAMCNLDWKLSD